jgi:hypothetical protein
MMMQSLSTTQIKTSEEFSVMVGMTNVSFAESASSLQGPNTAEVASGAVSQISSQLHYRFRTDDRKAWYGQFTFPLMGSGTGTYMAGGGGMEYYFGSTSPARYVLSDIATTLTMTPTTRYFLMGGINMGYLAYLTETAKKNDTLLEIEVGGGISRQFSKRWTIRASAGVARGIGIATTTMGMKALLGGIFYLD